MKKNKAVIIWLLSGCFLIFTMVVIGGITRLTDSGLSMSTWKLIGGAPPLNQNEWMTAFETYKATPEGKVNTHYVLDDFKFIFFWEYLHRMMGRLLGVVFIIPFLFFLIKKILKNQPNLFIQNTTFSLCFILCVQAFINIGSSIDLIPPTGMTLPFISYGGSSMLSYAIIFGTLINFSKNEKNSFSNTS